MTRLTAVGVQRNKVLERMNVKRVIGGARTIRENARGNRNSIVAAP